MAKPNLKAIYDQLQTAPTTHPSSMSTFYDWSIQAGDVVTVSQDGASYKTPVYTSSMNWNGGINVQTDSTGNETRQPIAKASQQKAGGGGGGGASYSAEQVKYAYIDIQEANGRIDIAASDIVSIKADLVEIEGELSAESIRSKIATLDYLTTIGSLYAQGGIDTYGARIECGDLYANSLQLDLGGIYAGSADISGDVSAESVTISGKDAETGLAYVTGVTNVTPAGSSTVTLRFSLGDGDPIDVSFNKGGQASGVSLSAVTHVRETQQGSGSWIGDTTVSLSGQQAAKTIDVNAAIDMGYRLGWAAARAKQRITYSTYYDVITISGAGQTVDTTQTVETLTVRAGNSWTGVRNTAQGYYSANGRASAYVKLGSEASRREVDHVLYSDTYHA